MIILLVRYDASVLGGLVLLSNVVAIIRQELAGLSFAGSAVREVALNIN